VAGLQQQIESLFTFLRIAFITRIILPCGIFMHAYKHWLDHDCRGIGVLIVGIAAGAARDDYLICYRRPGGGSYSRQFLFTLRTRRSRY
jgi:hypothetical protein